MIIHFKEHFVFSSLIRPQSCKVFYERIIIDKYWTEFVDLSISSRLSTTFDEINSAVFFVFFQDMFVINHIIAHPM